MRQLSQQRGPALNFGLYISPTGRQWRRGRCRSGNTLPKSAASLLLSLISQGLKVPPVWGVQRGVWWGSPNRVPSQRGRVTKSPPRADHTATLRSAPCREDCTAALQSPPRWNSTTVLSIGPLGRITPLCHNRTPPKDCPACPGADRPAPPLRVQERLAPPLPPVPFLQVSLQPPLHPVPTHLYLATTPQGPVSP